MIKLSESFFLTLIIEIRKSLKIFIQQNGYAGLWTGIVPTLCRDVPFSAIYWMSYENIKEYFGSEVPTLGLSFFAGAVSGSVSDCSDADLVVRICF